MVLWIRQTSSHRLQESCGEKGQHGHSLSERVPQPLPGQAFIGFNLHRNTGKAHQSLSGRKDQTIDNIQRTTRAYSESGSVS